MTFSLTDEQRNALSKVIEYLTIKDEPRNADAIFLAGGNSFAPVEQAAKIYHDGFSKKIVIVARTGNFTNPLWKNEAEEFCKKLLDLKVPEEAILWKAVATNTLEEAQIAIPFMKEHGIDPKTIILVTRPFHQRRVYATFKKIYPDIRFINYPANENVFTKEGLERAIGEVERLQKYARTGNLLDQHIPEDILETVEFLKGSEAHLNT